MKPSRTRNPYRRQRKNALAKQFRTTPRRIQKALKRANRDVVRAAIEYDLSH